LVLYIGIESARSSRTSKKQDELLDIEIDTKRRVNKAVREGRINALLIGIGTEDKIATEKLDNNTPDETPNEERLTIEEWQEKLGFQIHDPDGFDRTDTKLYERKFTQAQFMAGAEKSTMLGRDILIYKEICDKNPGINYPIHYDNLWALKDQGKPIDVAPRDDGSQEFVESITQGGNYAPPIPADGIPVAPDDRIPHEEKMIEAMTAPEPVESIEDVQELLSSIIYAPFDGEIVEIREGRFTIKANNKNMKISFDCDIFKVALHDKVVKNQILGQNII